MSTLSIVFNLFFSSGRGGGIRVGTVYLTVCLSAGLHKNYWMSFDKKPNFIIILVFAVTVVVDIYATASDHM